MLSVAANICHMIYIIVKDTSEALSEELSNDVFLFYLDVCLTKAPEIVIFS